MTNTPSRRPASILLVDDEPSIIELLREILAPDGYTFSAAHDGAVALDMVLKTDFDLIITDFRMPKLSGKGLYDSARESKPGIEKKFIFISGEMDPVTKTQFIKETGVRVISKPFRAELVRDAVRDALSTG